MRHVAAIVSVVVICALALAVFGLEYYLRGLAPHARVRVIQALSERFDADVQLKSLNFSLVPRPTVTGDGLVIQRRGSPAGHPLISVTHFSADANLTDLLQQHDRVDIVRLAGLQIHVPRGGSPFAGAFGSTAQASSDVLRIYIHEIVADGSLLEVEPKDSVKDPLQFPISKLTLWSVAMGQPLSFAAELQNAKPPGLIKTQGKFGPWQKNDPRSTSVIGTYDFSDADLSVFKGISGTLSSKGSYNGVLQRIDVHGETDTPDFSLTRGGEPVHLRTTFHSFVDGSNGETILDPVDASFLKSSFICQGGIVNIGRDTRKTVDLYAIAQNARMEDILTLIIGRKHQILEGTVDFKTKIVIPPGDQDVIDKLQLDGRFRLLAARFTSPITEQRLETLSDRARGISKSEEKDQPPLTVASNFAGQFRLMNGSVDFPSLSFEVPGAQIRLAGDYGLQHQQVQMKGVFRMNARLSQTQSGIRGWLLKPFDPLFEKDGAGFELPLTISGSRTHPVVSVYAFHHKFTVQ